MLYKSINKYQKWWVYIKNKSKHNIGLLYFVDNKKNYITLNNCFSWVVVAWFSWCRPCPELSPDLAMYLVPELSSWFSYVPLSLIQHLYLRRLRLLFLLCHFLFETLLTLLYQIFLLLPYFLHLHNLHFVSHHPYLKDNFYLN